MRTTCALIVVLGLSPSSIAQTPFTPASSAADVGVPLTLREALDRARANSARLSGLSALEDAARSGLAGARAGRMPRLDLSAGYSRRSDVPELRLPVPGSTGLLTIFPNIPDAFVARAEVSLPLYTGGRVSGSIAAADQKHRAAGRDLEAAAQDLVLETTAAYWSLVTARETARVVADSLSSFEAHLKDARNRFDLGLVARSEVLSVQVERDRAELSRLQADTVSAVANEDLVRLVGLPPGSRVEPVPPDTSGVAAEPDAESLVPAALAARPELLALRARAEAALAAVRVAGAPARPQVGVSAAYDYARPNPRYFPVTDDFKDSWSMGVNLSVTPFDGGRTAAATAQARSEAEALRHQVEDLERRVALEVKSLVLELGTATLAVRVADRALEAAKEAARVERDRYQEGVSASSDLLDAETRCLRAGVDRTNAVAAVNLTRARLDRALGR